ncbi:MAG: GLPGLI family protein [Pedobacter sp.]|nr:GLPGLI family protein [Chitinophagaceae bacterium]
MKKLLFAVVMILAFQAIKAQQKQGTVSYQRKTNTWKAIQNDEIRSRVPEFQIGKYILYFSDSLSMYKLIPDDNAPEPFGDGGGFRRFNFGGGDGDLYKNFTTGLSTQATELGGKNFLIVDTIKKAPWKISAETKQILGVNCRKATRKVLQPVRQQRTINFNNNNAPRDTTRPAPKEIEVVAWFAETILAPVGPDSYGQLPGVILELNVDDGSTVYTATEVKQTVDTKELKEPKKGKKVTRQEYAQLQRELFQNQGGGGGGQIIIRGGPGGQ